MRRQIIAVVFTLIAASACTAHARLVRVYYPAGHYLGCGTPAADGSGIWSYDPRISEADCHDGAAPRRPSTTAYVSASRIDDLEAGAPSVTEFREYTFEPVRTDAGTQIGPAPYFD
jgi:hypothetical protein